MKKPVHTLPIMKAHCKTCPFKEVDGKWQNTELANKVIERTLFKSQQICHGTESGKNRKANNRCKGAYEHNLEIYKRMNLDKYLL